MDSLSPSQKHTRTLNTPKPLPSLPLSPPPADPMGHDDDIEDGEVYIPVSNHRSRSNAEVDDFLQTGSKPEKKPKFNANANRQAKSGSKKKKSAPLNFDFTNPPEAVSWVLTDVDKGQWTPFVGDKIVPKSTRKEWNAAFHSCPVKVCWVLTDGDKDQWTPFVGDKIVSKNP